MSQLIWKLLGGDHDDDALFLDPFLSAMNKCPVLSAPTDWKETPAEHVFFTDVPGLAKDQVKVDVVDGDGGAKVLQISGEYDHHDHQKNKDHDDHGKDSEGGDHDEKWRRVERCRGKFLRRFRLPENAKADEITAAMEDGVLTVRVPKMKEVNKPERKVIQIN